MIWAHRGPMTSNGGPNLNVWLHHLYVSTLATVCVAEMSNRCRCSKLVMSLVTLSLCIFTARAYARAVLGVIILSVCPSVCLSHAWIVVHCRYTTRKSNHSATLTPTVVGGRRSLPSEICAESDPPPSRNADWQISTYNISTVRDSEKSSVMTNI